MKEFSLDLSNKSQWFIRAQDQGREENESCFPFRILECGYFDAGSKFMTRSDLNQGYYLNYTISGSGVMWQGTQKCDLLPGHMLAIDVSKAQEHYTTSAEPWKFHWVWFTGSGMKGFEKVLLTKLSTVKIRDENLITDLFLGIERPDTLQAPFLTAVADNLGLTRLLSQAVRESLEEKEAAYPHGVVAEIMDYVNNNLSEDLTINSISKHFAVSKFHLIRIFRQAMGVTPYQYIINTRINQSQLLLRTTNRPIGEIGEAVGCPEPSNFTQQFKKVVGITPAEFRKKSIHYENDVTI